MMDQGPKPKILLVDDSETVLIMEEMLLRRSYDVLKATSGAQALRIAAEKRPNLILLDIIMPDMNGLETCRLLRGMEATKTTPIIMVTTRSQADTVNAAFANGATDYVT
jgi:PleD family two-component response regulator